MKVKWDNLKTKAMRSQNRIAFKTQSVSEMLSVKPLEVSLTSSLMIGFSITFKAERLEAQVDLNYPTEFLI
jgi:hypothetical protein